MYLSFHDYKTQQGKTFEQQTWASKQNIKAFSSGTIDRDLLLGTDASIAFHEQDKEWHHAINGNVMVFGGTGAGKTMGFVGPNLAQALDCNYIVADPKGELTAIFADYYKSKGYRVSVLDSIELSKSDGYDPLRYISCEEDILSVAKLLLDSLSTNRSNTTDNFWNETSEMLVRAGIGILWELENLNGIYSPLAQYTEACDRTDPIYLRLNRLVDLLSLLRTQHAGQISNSPLDRLVKLLESPKYRYYVGYPGSSGYGVRQYQSLLCSAQDTLLSVIISTQTPMMKLDNAETKALLEHDDLNLDKIDEEKRIIFIKTSDNDSSKSFLSKMCIKQLFNIAQRKADSQGGRLKRNLMFVLDEFPNIGRIDNFERSIATVRSRGINFLMASQSLSQIERIYGSEGARTILDNCDTILYMGSGSSLETARYIASLCGEAELGTRYVGVEKTRAIAMENVITPGQVGLLSRMDCIIKISGCRPFKTTKLYLPNHPNASALNLKR